MDRKKKKDDYLEYLLGTNQTQDTSRQQTNFETNSWRNQSRDSSTVRSNFEGNPRRNQSSSRQQPNFEGRNQSRDSSTVRSNFEGNPRRNRSSSRQQPNFEGVNLQSNGRSQTRQMSENSMHKSRDGRNYIPKIWGFKKLQEILEKNSDDVLMELSKGQNSFCQLLEKNDISGDILVLLVQIIAKVSKTKNFLETKNLILKTSMSPNFIGKLKTYVNGLPVQDEYEIKKNSLFWENCASFFENLYIIFKTVYETMYYTAMDIFPSLLKATLLTINALQEEQIFVSEETKANLLKFKEVLDNELKNNVSESTESVKTAKTRLHVMRRRIGQRPNDIRDVSIFPLTQELCDPNYLPFIQENIVVGKYEDIEEYLDIHFRLLREDFVTPLRNGILQYIYPERNITKQSDVRIFNRVKCVGIETSKSCSYVFNLGINEKVSKKLKNSKRFLFGSLVCLSRDNFKSIIYGTITDRDEKMLSKGNILVKLEECNEVNIGDTFVMAESKIYFVPYYYILKSLQTIDLSQSRMKKYLIDVDISETPTTYINKPSSDYLMLKASNMKLNESQTVAFSNAISNEFVVIQGPPGTGKTFLGLKVAKELLNIVNGPMLVISLTNHALDQFLKGLLDCTNDIIRIGSQSKDEALNRFNLKNFVQKTVSKRNLQDKLFFLKKVNAYREKLEGRKTLIYKFQYLKIDFENEIQLLKWLFNDESIPNYIVMDFSTLYEMIEYICEYLPEDFQENMTEITIDNYNLEDSASTLDRIERNITNLKNILNYLNNDGMLYAFLRRSFLRCMEIFQTLQKKLSNIDFTSEVEPLKTKFSNDIYLKRWNYYICAVKNEYKTHIQITKKNISEYWSMKVACEEVDNYEKCEILKHAKVIGMTTTGAAKLQNIISYLNAPLVIIEEAAEVLEAHLIGVLGESCQHAILIGDHQQLRPSTNDFNLDVNYNLGISLFERMIMNDIQCTTLNIQHRMRPEIARLLTPSIYPDLKNADSVYNYPNVKGMFKNVFFVTHTNPESGEMESKLNRFEAEYLVLLARYLVLNGHPPESITILCTYLGQFYEVQKVSKNYALIRSVKICVLDNYQGEENNIILLSLVRNNTEGKIGFLRVENRICVALSRAKHGLYMLGNMDMLSKNSNIWKQVKDVLVEMNSFGGELPLFCQKHMSVTKIKVLSDFNKVSEGGCILPCAELLECSHTCLSVCHLMPHSEMKCHQPCIRILCEFDHVCPKSCSEECGKCMVPKTCTLPCGHVETIPCHKEPEDVKCSVGIVKTLPCKHEMEVLCSDDVMTVKCKFPCEARLESCGHSCERTCHIFDDQEHLQYKCSKPCEKYMKHCSVKQDNHKCPLKCSEPCQPCNVQTTKHRTCTHYYLVACSENPDLKICTRKCKKQLPCGHKCRASCNVKCETFTCKEKVSKVIEECGHAVNVLCSVIPNKSMCKMKCERILPCGHTCNLECRSQCNPDSCQEQIKTDKILPCKHKQEKLPCRLKQFSSDIDDYEKTKTKDFWSKWNDILETCEEPCNFELECGHICTGTCGKCKQGRLHIPCQEKCNKTLICGHSCKINCSNNCLPCKEKCFYKCVHSKCKKTCGAICTDCIEPCPIKCPHHKCKTRCGQICDVGPCMEPCPKKLKCSHNCIGFCGDPCPPKCKICDRDDETFDTFLGSEDEPDARFVYLQDCKHVIESTGLDNWFSLKSDEEHKVVQFLVCPKCKTYVNMPPRYSNDIIKVYKDMAYLKSKFFGQKDDIQNEMKKLQNKVTSLPSSVKSPLSRVVTLFLGLVTTHKLSIKKLNLSLPEIISYNSMLDLILSFNSCSKRETLDYPIIETFFDFFINRMIGLNGELKMLTNQELTDLQVELDRYNRMVQLHEILISTYNKNDTLFKTLFLTCLKKIVSPNRYNVYLDLKIKEDLKNLNKNFLITDIERKEIVKAMKLAKGHWFKCPNGHFYAIGECGGANQVGICPECKSKIGGSKHTLLSDNSLAPEIDGASFAAWSDLANMNNYILE